MIRLLRFAKDYRRQIILGPVFKFLEAVFELILPLQMAKLIDEGVAKHDLNRVWQMSGWMLLMSIIGMGCAMICQYFSSFASQGFGTELRNRLMKKINTLSHQDLNHFGTDTLITRMTNDVNQLQLALAMFIRLLVRAPFLSVGSVVMAFIIDPTLGLIYLVLLPIFALVLFLIIRFTVPLFKRVQQKLDGLNELLTQNLSGVRVIRAFARTKSDRKNFAAATDDLARQNEKVTNLSALLSPITTFIMDLGVIVLLHFGGIAVFNGRLQQGQVLALINYMNQMLLALIVLSNLVIIFTRAAASGQRVNEVLNTEPSLETPTAGIEAAENTQADMVAFSHVDFKYGAKAGLSLTDITFSMKQKSFLGITGATGSGKSTLVQLIPRFYDVAAGTIDVLGENVERWQLDPLRRQISQAPQTSVLFSGTIRDNLHWGKTDATDDECWQALKTAQCLDFVDNLPEKLDTPVMENGKNFSGGQQQRLTIARALIAKPQLLILDDSLSALDYQTDLNLREALKRDLDCAVIIISQRIKILQQADNILLMDSGKILAQGMHDALLLASPDYQELVASQEEN